MTSQSSGLWNTKSTDNSFTVSLSILILVNQQLEMELHLPLGHIMAMQLGIVWGYFYFIGQINQWSTDFHISPNVGLGLTEPCKIDNKAGRCPVNVPRSSVDKFNQFSLDASHVLFVHFHGDSSWIVRKGFLSQQGELTEYIHYGKAVDLVWVENITSPFLSLDLGFNVYSFTTLWRKVRLMSIKVNNDCLQNTTSSCLVSSMATAFLTQVSQRRGASCYIESGRYKCCQNNVKTQQIECGISPFNPQISRLIYTTIAVTAILFLCFPALFVRFRDETDRSETVSANTQASNPLYRIGNCAVQTLQTYSARYYFVHMIKKLVLGLIILPMFFYIDIGLTIYTYHYDIPKMFRNYRVKKGWINMRSTTFILEVPILFTYVALVIIISLLPRTESLDFSLLPNDYRVRVQYQYFLMRNAHDKHFALDWIKPSCSFTRTIFQKFCFGFNGLLDSQTSFCWRIIRLGISCFLLSIVFPVVAIYVFTGYGLYVSPLGREITFLFCHAEIYFYWLTWRLTILLQVMKSKWSDKQHPTPHKAVINPHRAFLLAVRGLGSLLILFGFLAPVAIIVSTSLRLIARLITYFYMGIVASNNELSPHIALFSLFAFYIWNCFSSVGNTYRDLLDQTFDMCQEYQEKENRQIIILDHKGAPRIPRLSDLFQQVSDEIAPFSKAYAMMCAKIVMIALFLCLTYFSILVFGEKNLNDLTTALAVALGGLIPKLAQIFERKNSFDKENAFRLKKIVYDFFQRENAHKGKESAIETQMKPLDNI